ncbi:RelA/SpoT domain-containing protein [Mucilaginibacter gotjawali]|uniref:RelA/SpoT domain-containing protein n=1 Tax=Mucilaginibacter gotjawali TaxID=1550579 RepID=UPI0021D10A28|nr:RelA/SpoT domain-containing protein [Mucilaginibacter gotjawali]
MFRRPPDARPKKVGSIIRKLNTDNISKDRLFEGLCNIEDIAGARLTIATQDQYCLAEELIKKSLTTIGEIELKKRWRKDEHANGYCADHYIIKKHSNRAIKCEIQVRTLTHDLWAVFTHYESYKSNERVENSRADEIKNYSRLMDVSDYYAKLIKDRKIQEANEFHKKNSPVDSHNNILTVDELQEILFEEEATISKSKIDVIKLCDLLRGLSTYQIFTLNDLKETLGNAPFKSALLEIISEVNKEKGTEHKMDILDAFPIIFKCRNTNKTEFRNGDITRSMRIIIKGYVSAWKLEMEINDRIDNITFERDDSE